MLGGSPPNTEVTIKGLTSGTTYTFTVQASNTNGSGSASEQSNGVVPFGTSPPSAPTAVAAGPATGQALVSWSPPANEGGSQISGYTITPYLGSTPQTAVRASGAATSVVVSGLTNGAGYTFTVAASNELGEGPASSASSPITPENTILDFATPATIDSGDSSSVNIGVKFSSELAGNVVGIRFYKAGTNTGTHVGSLWSASGKLLASATFTSETATGWQQVNFSTPVSIAANTTYVASYLAPKGHYSISASAFSPVGTNNPPLQALANSVSVNGVYTYNSTTAFPVSSFNATNYWVDLLFAPMPLPGRSTNVTATPEPNAANVSWNAPVEGGPVNSYTITPYIGKEAQTPTTITGSPPATGATVKGLTNGTHYTFVVQASNANGSGPASAESNEVTPMLTVPGAPTEVSATAATGQAQVNWSAPTNTGGTALTGYTITPYLGSTAQTPLQVGAPTTSAIVKGLSNGTAYTFTVAAINSIGEGHPSTGSSPLTPQNTIFDFATPTTLDSGDTKSTELGVKFSSELAGNVTGIRFYKATANTGTHVGSLWSANGTLLASATFTSETATGWQQVNFSSPVAISAKTTYVAAYLASKGHYSDSPSQFATVGVSSPPLQALSTLTSANGIYSYSATSTFPTSTYKATNYWVDVEYEP